MLSNNKQTTCVDYADTSRFRHVFANRNVSSLASTHPVVTRRTYLEVAGGQTYNSLVYSARTKGYTFFCWYSSIVYPFALHATSVCCDDSTTCSSDSTRTNMLA